MRTCNGISSPDSRYTITVAYWGSCRKDEGIMSGFAPRETGKAELRRFAKKLVHDVVQGLLLRMPFETGQDVVALVPVANEFC